MKGRILIRGARQLLTLHGPTGPRRGEALRELGLILDGSVLIVDGIITSVGPSRRVENLAEAKNAVEINANGCVVMPGFVDCHTHLVTGPPRILRYQMERRELRSSEETTLHSVMHYVRNTAPGTLEFNAWKHLAACLRHGTTTLEAKSGFGFSQSSEYKILKVLHTLVQKGARIVPTFVGVHALPPEFRDNPEKLIEELCTETLPKIRERRWAEFADVLCGPGGLSLELARRFMQRARELRFGIKVHADMVEPSGAVEMAVEMGAASVDGLNQIGRSGIEALAQSSTVGVLLPGTVHRGAFSTFAPARALIDAGAAVALGSAFQPALNSSFNMQTIVSLACTHMDMTPEEAIAASTVNAAHAVGRASTCGTLEFGKQADVILLNVPDYREIPYYFGANMVALTMCSGEVAYRQGEVTAPVPQTR